MPTSAPGSSRSLIGARGLASPNRRRGAGAASLSRRLAAGFTLIELLIVIAIVAIGAGVMSLALRDGNAARLEQEGERLSALLEMARTESRVSGRPVRWLPAPPEGNIDPAVQFRFVGLSAQQAMPTRWLDGQTRAEVVGTPALVLGPQAILPPQRVVLRLAEQRIEVASDGLSAFAIVGAAPAAATP